MMFGRCATRVCGVETHIVMNWKDQLLAEEGEKIQKAVLDASCRIWTVQQARTHPDSALSQSYLGILLSAGPAVTHRARYLGTNAMYHQLSQSPAGSINLQVRCLSHDLAHYRTPFLKACHAVVFGEGSRQPEAAT